MDILLPTSPRLRVRELLLDCLKRMREVSPGKGRLSRHWTMHVSPMAAGVMRVFQLVGYHTRQWMHTSLCQFPRVSRVLGT